MKQIVLIGFSIAIIVVVRLVLEDIVGITTSYAAVIATVVGISVYAKLNAYFENSMKTDSTQQTQIDDLKRELEEVKRKLEK